MQSVVLLVSALRPLRGSVEDYHDSVAPPVHLCVACLCVFASALDSALDSALGFPPDSLLDSAVDAAVD